MFSPGADTEVIGGKTDQTLLVSLKYFSKSEGPVVNRKRSGLSINARLDNSSRMVSYDASGCYESCVQTELDRKSVV